MKSNICKLSTENTFDKEMIAEVNKVASYNELDPKSTMRLTLMAEELIGMLPNLSEGYEGDFWVESEGNAYELHAKLRITDRSLAKDDKLLAISKSGKNAAAKGVIGKIRAVIDKVTLPEGGAFFRDYAIFESGMMEYSMGYAQCWSLSQYALGVRAAEASEETAEAWDELEKSVITKLADDVLVGLKGDMVEITVKKAF